VIAHFVRLKVQLLANMFRRSPWQVVGIVIGLLYGMAITTAAVLFLTALRFAPLPLARTVVVLGGALVYLGHLVVPLIIGVDDTLDPRRFALLGISRTRLALGLAVAALLGIPSIAMIFIAFGTVATWSRSPTATLVALLAAPVVVATCVLLARISAAAGGLLVSTRRSREALTVVALLGIVCIAPLIALLSSLDYGKDASTAFARLAHVVAWTPLGAAWAAPGWVASSSPGGLLQLFDAVVFVALLWLIWQALVARTIVTQARQGRAQTFSGLGWFGRLPSTPRGAIAARSLTYWGRDVRYRVSFAMVPITPVLIIAPLLLVGVQPSLLALVPVPCIALFLGWMSHNDVAYDSTAVWLHVASGTRGDDDRLGRAAPVLAIGVPVVVIGSIVCGVLYGDPLVAAGIAGVSGCLLLSGLGISFVSSARFPYPVPRPGDSPFQQPNATTGITAAVQSVTFFAQFLLALPAVLLATLGIFGNPLWHLAALVAGLLLGAAVFLLGLRLGSRIFERRGPEILASAMRA